MRSWRSPVRPTPGSTSGPGRVATRCRSRSGFGEVVAVEPSDGDARGAAPSCMTEHGIANVRVVADRWPPAAGSPADAVRTDVALIAHIGYDIEPIGPFLDAMETAAARLCVAVLMERQPSSVADPFWPPIHGEARVRLPALHELVELLRARGRIPEVELFDRPARGFASIDELHGFVRRQLWLARGRRRRTAAARRARPGRGRRARRPAGRSSEPATSDRGRRPGLRGLNQWQTSVDAAVTAAY